MHRTSRQQRVAVIGGGPAGLMAAEGLVAHGFAVSLYDAMPSVGRKFLMAGRGGLNLTHSEPPAVFVRRYGTQAAIIASWLAQMDAQAVRAWADELGVSTFVGSSGRVFPETMKAAPLLRAWLARLRISGVHFFMRHRWLGWPDDALATPAALHFDTPHGSRVETADALVLALGGGSWAKLGSDGAWMAALQKQGVALSALRAANCGFDAAWSPFFSQRYGGQPVKAVSLRIGEEPARRGEFVVTQTGVEGSLVYACSAHIRDQIEAQGQTCVSVDLLPDWPEQKVLDAVSYPRGARSWSSHLQSRLGLRGVKVGLLRECVSSEDFHTPARLAEHIKALPIPLLRPRPIDEAISTAGGVSFDALTSGLQLRALAGVYCAGEMLDWEAPTGGYLLTACLASGRTVADSIARDLSAC